LWHKVYLKNMRFWSRS